MRASLQAAGDRHAVRSGVGVRVSVARAAHAQSRPREPDVEAPCSASRAYRVEPRAPRPVRQAFCSVPHA